MNFLTNLNLNKNELQNAVLHPLAVSPNSPVYGQIYFNSTDNIVYIYNGANWVPVGVVYNQESNTGIVVAGLDSSGNVYTTQVIDLTLTGYAPIPSGYVTNGMTLEQAFNVLDTAIKNAVAGGGEPNQNAWSYITVPSQSTNNSQQVATDTSSNTLSATSPTDSFSFQSGDQWVIVTGNEDNKTITLGHKFSGVGATQYGSSLTVPQITVDVTGHITNVANQTIVGAQYITNLTSDAQQQLNDKISSNLLGQPNGVATLGNDGLVPSSQLPSYVDDVVEVYIVGSTPYAQDWFSLTSGGPPLTPEQGKIYVVISSGDYQNQQYRWTGSTYILCNPSDVNSVNGKTGVVVLTQDDIGAGTTYTQFSITNLNKLNGIAANATVNNITLNGQSNQNPSFYAPTTSGSSGQVLLSSGSGAPTWGNMPQAFTKYVGQNAQLTASGGAFTWTIPSSVHNINNNGIIVQIYEVSSGDQIIADIAVNPSNFTITITINDVSNMGTLSANTYKVVAFG